MAQKSVSACVWVSFLLLAAMLAPILGGSEFLVSPVYAYRGNWTATGPLNTARDSHTTTLLPDGRVLIAGGWGIGGLLDSAEIYDPATGLDCHRPTHKWTRLAYSHPAA